MLLPLCAVCFFQAKDDPIAPAEGIPYADIKRTQTVFLVANADGYWGG